MEQLSEAHLRYLMTIYDLAHTMLDVRAAEVAKVLQITKPSVTKMLGVLMDKGFLVRERYGKIYLTDSGFLLAKEFTKRVELLQTLIPNMGLALSEEELSLTAGLLAASLPEHAFSAPGA